MSQNFNLRDKRESLRCCLITLPHTIGVLAVNFSKERFRAGGWLDGSFQPVSIPLGAIKTDSLVSSELQHHGFNSSWCN